MKQLISTFLISMTTMLFATNSVINNNQFSEKNEQQKLFLGKDCATYGIVTFGQFLWWQGEESDISYSFDNDQVQVDDTLDLFAQGPFLKFRPSWDPGFRVGAGWQTPYDQWVITSYWTSFHNYHQENTTRAIVDSIDTLGLRPIWLTLRNNSEGFGRVRANYYLFYDAFSADLSKTFLMNSLQLEPFIGGDLLWLKRRMKINYDTNNAATIPNGEYKGKIYYWGVGPKIGAKASINLGYGFKIYSYFSSGLFSGKAKGNAIVAQSGSQVLSPEQISYPRYVPFWRVIQQNRIETSIGWQACYKKNKNELTWKARLGWEINQWNNLPYFISTTDISSNDIAYLRFSYSKAHSSLATQGYTAHFELDF